MQVQGAVRTRTSQAVQAVTSAGKALLLLPPPLSPASSGSCQLASVHAWPLWGLVALSAPSVPKPAAQGMPSWVAGQMLMMRAQHACSP